MANKGGRRYDSFLYTKHNPNVVVITRKIILVIFIEDGLTFFTTERQNNINAEIIDVKIKKADSALFVAQRSHKIAAFILKW